MSTRLSGLSTSRLSLLSSSPPGVDSEGSDGSGDREGRYDDAGDGNDGGREGRGVEMVMLSTAESSPTDRHRGEERDERDERDEREGRVRERDCLLLLSLLSSPGLSLLILCSCSRWSTGTARVAEREGREEREEREGRESSFVSSSLPGLEVSLTTAGAEISDSFILSSLLNSDPSDICAGMG